MKLVIVFMVGFAVGQIWYSPAFYRVYQAVGQKMIEVNEEKQILVNRDY